MQAHSIDILNVGIVLQVPLKLGLQKMMYMKISPLDTNSEQFFHRLMIRQHLILISKMAHLHYLIFTK